MLKKGNDEKNDEYDVKFIGIRSSAFLLMRKFIGILEANIEYFWGKYLYGNVRL